jgi:hypothetical protein
LPEPTGPPTPTRNGPRIVIFTVLASFRYTLRRMIGGD